MELQCGNAIIFQDIQQEDCTRMLGCFEAVRRGYLAGETIPADHSLRSVGVVENGSLSVTGVDIHGNRAILERLGPGGVFGEVLAFAGAGQSGIDVVCETEASVVYIGYDHIVRETLRKRPCSCRRPSVVENLLRLIADKTLSLERAGGGAEPAYHPGQAAVLFCPDGAAAGRLAVPAALSLQHAGGFFMHRPKRHEYARAVPHGSRRG